jgi:hypothetical protein
VTDGTGSSIGKQKEGGSGRGCRVGSRKVGRSTIMFRNDEKEQDKWEG